MPSLMPGLSRDGRAQGVFEISKMTVNCIMYSIDQLHPKTNKVSADCGTIKSAMETRFVAIETRFVAQETKPFKSFLGLIKETTEARL
jgi:hypothetical protein